MRRLILTLCALLLVLAAGAQVPTLRYAAPKGCEQLILVEATEGCNSVVTLLDMKDGMWSFVATLRGTVGYNGTTTAKREGDGCTPEGVYELRRGMYYECDFESAFPMVQYHEHDMWIEDPKSELYNTFLPDAGADIEGDRLWQRRETQYRYIVVVEYNTDPIVRGAGSAIFIHTWRAPGKPTAGCIGLAEGDVKRIVEWLQPACNPHIMIQRAN